MARIRFIMVGGFLGAGKTTAIARLGHHYSKAGLRVGLVTNDQAHGLVDTLALKSQGFNVGEVPGACFCCKFNDLVDTIGQLKQEHQPDVVITEPVGSCTDLVATVIEPLRQFHRGQFDIAPLTVLLKPEHGLKILGKSPRSGFSPQAAYIFLKQIEEADVVAINKTDKLTAAQQEELLAGVEERFPGKTVFRVSGKTGAGFEALTDAIDGMSSEHKSMMDVDYERYAEGEAELGWLNATYRITAGPTAGPALNGIAMAFLEHIRDGLRRADAEPAHLKVLCDASGQIAVANLVGSEDGVELSVASDLKLVEATVLVNARAATDPTILEDTVRASAALLCHDLGVNAELESMERFRPSAPVPTHRVTSE